MFTCISNADRLLIPLVCFSLYHHLLDSYVDFFFFSRENIKSGIVAQDSVLFPILYFSQQEKKKY